MHYFVGLLALALVLAFGRRWASTPPKLFVLAVAAAVAVYITSVVSAYATSAAYAYYADSFDRDGDGVISLAEQSDAQSSAMERAVNDSGRNLTVFFAIPWSVLSSALAFGPVAVVRSRRRKHAPASAT
jgi:hypothetical protein